ncbi:Uncharacterised protein [uncultured archaeon]|nr:Uncharacterised protein [uncultured archaeon]
MLKIERTQDSIFQKCTTDGEFNALSKVDVELIKTMRDIALLDMGTVKKWSLGEGDWNALFKLGYDVLHTLAEAFVYFDKIKAERHECLFAYLCDKHPELEFDWNFLDNIRIIRNRSIYYGKPATYDNWKLAEFQLNLYINTLKKTIEEKLKTEK